MNLLILMILTLSCSKVNLNNNNIYKGNFKDDEKSITVEKLLDPWKWPEYSFYMDSTIKSNIKNIENILFKFNESKMEIINKKFDFIEMNQKDQIKHIVFGCRLIKFINDSDRSIEYKKEVIKMLKDKLLTIITPPISGINKLDLSVIEHNQIIIKVLFSLIDEITDLEILLNMGVDINLKNEDGHTLLHYAAADRYSDNLIELLKAGADRDEIDNNGKTALHYAAENRYSDNLIELLKSGTNIDAIDNDGKTALHYAAENGCTNNLIILLKAGADTLTDDKNKKRAIDYAREKKESCRNEVTFEKYREMEETILKVEAGQSYDKVYLPIFNEYCQLIREKEIEEDLWDFIKLLKKEEKF